MWVCGIVFASISMIVYIIFWNCSDRVVFFYFFIFFCVFHFIRYNFIRAIKHLDPNVSKLTSWTVSPKLTLELVFSSLAFGNRSSRGEESYMKQKSLNKPKSYIDKVLPMQWAKDKDKKINITMV